jgi:hypothetical protein
MRNGVGMRDALAILPLGQGTNHVMILDRALTQSTLSDTRTLSCSAAPASLEGEKRMTVSPKDAAVMLDVHTIVRIRVADIDDMLKRMAT